MKLLIGLLLISTLARAEIADAILENYQSQLYKLPFVQQEHFSTRMYSITGDEAYLNPIIVYLYLLSTKFKALTMSLDNELMIDDENKRLLSVSELYSDKRKLRIKKIEQSSRTAFYLNFLILIKKIYFYKLEKTALFPNVEVGNNFLRSQKNNLEQFLLDEKNIKIYGAQLINYVYYLFDLDIVDLRERYTQKFKDVFPDDNDPQLSTLDYAAKIYGMTHFIIAASNYYQLEPDNQLFTWISTYFENNIDEIIRRTENDVIAEVGVCFMLLNKGDLLSVKKIKSYLASIYDEKHKMIPDKELSFDLTKGEHRNILTIMLFKWPEKLTPIPNSIMDKILSSGFVLNEVSTEVNYGFNLI